MYEIPKLISKDEQQKYYDYVTDLGFDWHYLEDATYERTIDETRSTPAFAHLLYLENETQSPHYEVFAPILTEFLNRSELKVKRLIRARLGFLLNTVYCVPHLQYSYNKPHIDYEEDHMVGLYYFNNTDGDTVVFNQTEESKKYTVQKRVTPEAGKFFAFDGQYYHASTCPKMFTKRIVLTFNFTVEK